MYIVNIMYDIYLKVSNKYWHQMMSELIYFILSVINKDSPLNKHINYVL